jgi:Mg-chelatase subunit ChlI
VPSRFTQQVRAVVDLLPDIDVVVDDPFNSSPTDPKLMGPDALQRFRAGEKLPSTKIRTPLVRAWFSYT